MNDEADIQCVSMTPDPENAQMHLIAKIAAQVLTKHYPNHLWVVGWMPGMALAIKNMAIDDGRYGFTVDVPRASSVSELEREIVKAGGELLERCGVPRGAWDGEWLHLQDKS